MQLFHIFKTDLIIPLLKKPGLVKEDLKNYRPVSNLSFISKVLEKVVAKRLDDHMLYKNLYSSVQSAYRERHSTETALLKVQSDILTALDSGLGAFDTIEYRPWYFVVQIEQSLWRKRRCT